MNESQYQTALIKTIQEVIPGCMVLKNDPRQTQGIPDLIVLFEDKWAVLELKISRRAKISANQQHYIDTMGAMSFASFIYPENEEEVLSALQYAFGLTRETCIS
jgi:hypothetical protein